MLLLAAAALAAPAARAQAAAAADDPWAPLVEVRRQLRAAGPQAADFAQTYLPVGFSSGGEAEEGRLAVALPDCLRWDYDEPYPKSFLVCNDQLYYWNEADGTGRRQAIASREEPGLDLLLLEPRELARRYAASVEEGTEGTVVLVLVPHAELEQVREARLTLAPQRGRVEAMEIRDGEGNLTRFELSGWRPLEEVDLFRPPAGIEWQEAEAGSI